MKAIFTKLKDFLLDLSGHYWLHLVAGVVIIVLYCENKHRKEELQNCKSEYHKLEDCRSNATSELILRFLHQGLISHQLNPEERVFSTSEGGTRVHYWYALTEEEAAAVQDVQQIRKSIQNSCIPCSIKDVDLTVTVQPNKPQYQYLPPQDAPTVPPDHTWYNVNVELRFHTPDFLKEERR
ncbi:MAG: hypothetical protein IKZ10_05120 [Akkermansia sp.]|nr:hypothetical protein [Akkermansia sp.]